MRLNLIAEPSDSTQLPPSVQCAPTYCILESGSNRIAVGLRNVLAKSIPIHQGLLWITYNRPGWYPMIRVLNYRINRVPLGEGVSWILDKLNLEGLDSWTAEQQQSAKIVG